MSIIRQGNTDLDEYKEILEKNNYYAIEEIDEHYYTIFPIGVSIVAVPFVYAKERGSDVLSSIGDILVKYHIIGSQYKAINPTKILKTLRIERFIASFIVALTSVFIYIICYRFFQSKYSLLISLIFAFCTSAWSTASRALWQHGPSMLMLTIGLYIILRAREKPPLIQYASIPLAFSYVIRPTNVVSIFLLTVYVAIQYRRYLLHYLLWAMIIAVPFLFFNFSIYHSLLSPYYSPQKIGSNPDFFEALAGNLISPARGLFVFTPILLFSIYGVVLRIKNNQADKLDYFLLVIIFLHWVVISSADPKWWAGHSFGPRLFSDMTPYFIYFLIPGVAGISKLNGLRKVFFVSAFTCFIIISFFIHFRGGTKPVVYGWNAKPVNVDERPARVWDWRDIQFLR
jgi:hypothetical protein